MVRVKRPTAIERTYYPYNTIFRQTFRIRFPTERKDGRGPTISPSAKWVALRFSGAKGSTDLVWDLDH